MFGFVGMGAAGGNVADEAAKSGFKSIAINYSQRDLNSLENIEERLQLVGSEGVGKDREKAIRLIRKNWESAVSFVKENLSAPSVEVIVVAFSTGGGSGSGMAPILLEILKNEMPEKTFVAAPILPDLSEVVVNQMNCLKTCEELSTLDICVLPIDNEQTRKKLPNVGKNKIYKRTNENFVHLIKRMVRFTEMESKNGVLDNKDLHTILTTKGIAAIAEIDITRFSDGELDISDAGIAKLIHTSWDNSVFAPIQYDRIIRAGVVYEGQDTLMEYLNFKRIFEDFENGMPIDLFEGYYSGNGSKVLTIISGLSWFSRRLTMIEKNVEDRRTATEEALSETGSYESSVKDFSMKMRKEKKSSNRSVTDILSKYNR